MSDNGRYVSFIPKTDGTNEIISADHINELQDVSERTQQGIFKAQDRDFLDKALFVLEHHRTLNTMWLDMFENTTKINLVKSTNVVFSEVEQGVALDNDVLEGEIYSTIYAHPTGENIKEVLIIASAYIPANTNVKVYVSNDGADWTQVMLTSDAVMKLSADGSYLMLKAVMTRTSADATSPRLDAWAVLFKDPTKNVIELPDGTNIDIEAGGGGLVGTNPGGTNPDTPGSGMTDIIGIMHNQLMGIGPDDHHDQYHTHDGTDGSGLVSHKSLMDVGEDDHHAKDHQHGQDGVSLVNLETDVIGTLPVSNLSYQIWTGKPGSTGLYFDPDIGDKLVYVKTPDDETYMFYDLVEDRLDHTITIVQGVAVWEQLFFGTYINSAGESTIVLSSTEKTHYDATDPMIVNEISLIAAPKSPVGLEVIDTGLGGILIVQWTPNLELDLVGYNLYVSTNGGITWSLWNTTGLITTPSVSVNGLTDGALYHFRVEAIDNTGYASKPSVEKSATPSTGDVTAPLAPIGVSAFKVNPGEVEVVWAPNTEPDFQEYRIYVSATGGSSTFTHQGTVNSIATTSHTITGLTAYGMYYVFVTAVDLTGNESQPSSIINVMA